MLGGDLRGKLLRGILDDLIVQMTLYSPFGGQNIYTGRNSTILDGRAIFCSGIPS